jgi:hypothetical protein
MLEKVLVGGESFMRKSGAVAQDLMYRSQT